MVFAYFPLPILGVAILLGVTILLGVDADVAVGDPAVDLVVEVDGVAHRPVEDVGAAIELLGHDAQVLRQRFPVIAGRIWLGTILKVRTQRGGGGRGPKSVRSKRGCVNLVLCFSPKGVQGGRGGSKKPKNLRTY